MISEPGSVTVSGITEFPVPTVISLVTFFDIEFRINQNISNDSFFNVLFQKNKNNI